MERPAISAHAGCTRPRNTSRVRLDHVGAGFSQRFRNGAVRADQRILQAAGHIRFRQMAPIPVLALHGLLLRGLVHAGNSVQTSGIADIGQALRNHSKEELFIITHVQIALGMGGELRLAPALGRQKAESDHLPLGQGQAGTGVVIAKAVLRQPTATTASPAPRASTSPR